MGELEGRQTWRQDDMGETEQMAEVYSRHLTHPRPVRPDKPVGTPRRKSVEFDVFRFTFDYRSDHLYVEEIQERKDGDPAPRSIRFSKAELEELRSALRSFGQEVAPGDQVTCR